MQETFMSSQPFAARKPAYDDIDDEWEDSVIEVTLEDEEETGLGEEEQPARIILPIEAEFEDEEETGLVDEQETEETGESESEKP